MIQRDPNSINRCESNSTFPAWNSGEGVDARYDPVDVILVAYFHTQRDIPGLQHLAVCNAPTAVSGIGYIIL